MTGPDAERLLFLTGMRYAAESIETAIEALALCDEPDPHCQTCEAYRIAAATATKWLDTELGIELEAQP